MLTLNVKSFYIKSKSLTLNVKQIYITGNFYIKGCNRAFLQLGHQLILTKYEAVFSMAVSEILFLIRDANYFDKNSKSIYFK